ncbi:MAG: helix-turn-helix domain-containing protein, partial [Candidatus Omnitrophica bacterium]|nr:helix-turn-helix domain-containing protein [Candidatus Omnitrophota bacterium]
MNPIIKPISVILKEARKNKGLSFDEIYRATKIHPKILRSLEEGTTLGLSHVYVRGYIRIYARYLGINQEELDKYFRPVIVQKEKKSHLDFSFRTKGDKIWKLSNIYSLNKLRFQIKHHKKTVVISVVFFALALLGLSKCSHRKESISQL